MYCRFKLVDEARPLSILSTERGKIDIRQLDLTWSWLEQCLKLVRFCRFSRRLSLIFQEVIRLLNDFSYLWSKLTRSFELGLQTFVWYSILYQSILFADRYESLSFDSKRFARPQDRSLKRSIRLRLSDPFTWKCTSWDHFWSEPTSGTFVLTDRVVHAARSQQLVDLSGRWKRSSVDRTGRWYHSWFVVCGSLRPGRWTSSFSPKPITFQCRTNSARRSWDFNFSVIQPIIWLYIRGTVTDYTCFIVYIKTMKLNIFYCFCFVSAASIQC